MVAAWFSVALLSSSAHAASALVFDDVVISDGTPTKRAPAFEVTEQLVSKLKFDLLRNESLPLTGSQRAIQPTSDSIEKQKFQTALEFLREGENLFVNQQYQLSAKRFSQAMALLEGLSFDGAIHGLLVSTHIMWGEALMRRGETTKARQVLGDLVSLQPSLSLSKTDYPNSFLLMLDEVRIQRLELAPGTLVVRSPRGSVQVTLNQVPLGMLPLEVQSVLPGLQVVRFETGTMGAKSRMVRIAAGEVLELAFELDSLTQITSVNPKSALSANAIDQVVVEDLVSRIKSRGVSQGIVPVWHFKKRTWKLALLMVSRSGMVRITGSHVLKEWLADSKRRERWVANARPLSLDEGWTSVVSNLPIRLALPSWLVGAPAIRVALNPRRRVELQNTARSRIEAIQSGGDYEEPISDRGSKHRPLSRAELAKKFEGQSYEATVPISLDDLAIEDRVGEVKPLWQEWWFWTAVGGAAAAAITATILAQDGEPSTVLVGVSWD